jgi:hypothetical protein
MVSPCSPTVRSPIRPLAPVYIGTARASGLLPAFRFFCQPSDRQRTHGDCAKCHRRAGPSLSRCHQRSGDTQHARENPEHQKQTKHWRKTNSVANLLQLNLLAHGPGRASRQVLIASSRVMITTLCCPQTRRVAAIERLPRSIDLVGIHVKLRAALRSPLWRKLSWWPQPNWFLLSRRGDRIAVCHSYVVSMH